MKARNREINIFNMSLLDILCGALGAFCFLALTLFPYYGKDNAKQNGATEQELQKLQNELQEALKAAGKGDMSGVVKSLQEQVRQYQQALQKETAARQQESAARQQESAARQQAQKALDQDEKTLAMRIPVTVQAIWDGADHDIDVFIKRETLHKTEPAPVVDKKQGPYILGDSASDCKFGPCAEIWQMRDMPVGNHAEVYYKLVDLKNSPAGTSRVMGNVVWGDNQFIGLPTVYLNASRRMVMVGALTMQPDYKLTFAPAVASASQSGSATPPPGK